KDTRDYLAAAFPELNAWERAGADASSAGMVDAGFENQKELTKMQLDNQKEIAEMQNETQKEIAGIQSATSRQLSLLLPSLLIMFIPSTFKRPVSSWKALNLRKTLLMASSVRLKPLNCSRLPCVYAQETLTFLLTQKKTCVKNYVQKE